MFIKSDHMASFDVILEQYPEITLPTYNEVAVKHSTTHQIDTRGPPVVTRPRRLAPDRYAVAQAEFDQMLEQGIIGTFKQLILAFTYGPRIR